jgi:hypothetical protein
MKECELLISVNHIEAGSTDMLASLCSVNAFITSDATWTQSPELHLRLSWDLSTNDLDLID